MGKLIDGDDGMPVEEVGAWAKNKHQSLCSYVDISRAVRRKWLGPGKAGATLIDLFCGPGRAKVRRTGEFIDGGCVAAWKASVTAKTPFTQIVIADADRDRRVLAAKRLSQLNAPVRELDGDAATAAITIRRYLGPHALHFAFLDPYNLGAFDFQIIRELSRLKYIDMLVHVSKMDLQRNTGMNVKAQRSAFDTFAPGWRTAIDLNQPHQNVRRDVLEYWRDLLRGLNVFPSADMQLLKGSKGQHLYWLTLAARHELAHKFWKIASNPLGQRDIFDV